MRVKYYIYLLLFSLFFSCMSKDQKVETKESHLQLSQVKHDSITNDLSELYNEGVFNGFVVSIVKEDGVIYNEGFGYADVAAGKQYSANTVINIASVSKVFIGVALMKAYELNLLKLDDPINKYLPFEVVNPNYPDEAILINQLATHTSSIVDNESYMKYCYANKDDISLEPQLEEKYELYYANPSTHVTTLSQFLMNMLHSKGKWYDGDVFDENNSPGGTYEYSNIGASLCALIIENAANISYSDFTKKYIFNPLNMSSTAWFFEDVDMSNHSKLYYDSLELPYYHNLSYPDGALITSGNDLALFLSELIKGYNQNGTLLKSESYKKLFKSRLTPAQLNERENFNVGFFVEKELPYNVIGHNGGDPGTNTMMYFNTETNLGRLMLLNSDSKKENSRDVMWAIWDVLGSLK